MTPDDLQHSESRLDRQTLERAIAAANIPTLLMVLVQLTGELKWLEEPYRPTRGRGLSENDTGDLPEEIQKEIRSAAIAAISAWQNGKAPAIQTPSYSLLAKMLSVSMGEPVSEDYGPMIAEDLELAIRGNQPPVKKLAVPKDFNAVIIGAGVSGLLAASVLKRAGIRCTVLEKNDSVGGCWYVNRYPGCGVDVPSHLYSYSFRIDDWQNYYASRNELHDYLQKAAADWEVMENIRLKCNVDEARYLPKEGLWSVVFTNENGERETLRANIMIVAVGAFGSPKMPDIPGLRDFRGEMHHTATWPADADVSGRRVGIIGNGASAMQVVPAIASKVKQLNIFQRTPHWVAPFGKFKTSVPEEVRVLIREVPYYRAWYRQRLAWLLNDTLYEALQRDPAWPEPQLSINAINDGHRRAFSRYIRDELEGREDLIEQVTPGYPPFGKRILLDNGWYKSLLRDNVDLITTPIEKCVPDGVVLKDGKTVPLDTLILATGFDVVRFISSFEIYGRSGTSLREHWDDDDAQAYLGTVIPDFPNMFCMYGPNTQAGHGGSLIFYLERQFHYIMDVLEKMLGAGKQSVEIRQDVHDEYNNLVQKAHDRMIWSHPGISTYYKNARGRIVVSNPWKVIDFWKLTNSADLGEYITETIEEKVEA